MHERRWTTLCLGKGISIEVTGKESLYSYEKMPSSDRDTREREKKVSSRWRAEKVHRRRPIRREKGFSKLVSRTEAHPERREKTGRSRAELRKDAAPTRGPPLLRGRLSHNVKHRGRKKEGARMIISSMRTHSLGFMFL